jgi:hypothetical protein
MFHAQASGFFLSAVRSHPKVFSSQKLNSVFYDDHTSWNRDEELKEGMSERELLS